MENKQNRGSFKLLPKFLALTTSVICSALPAISAENIVIANASFEEPAMADGGFNEHDMPGWIGVGIFPVANPRDDWFPGTTSGTSLPNPINGLNAGGLNTGATIYQDLTTTVQPGTGYTLSMLTGYRLGVPFGTLTVSLIAGGEVLVASVAPAPVEGTFSPFQVTYNSPTNGAMLGQTLRLQLSSSGVNAQPWFDNLKLATGATNPPPPPPPPSGLVMSNASFESPILADGQYAIGTMSGWVGAGTYTQANPRDDWFAGTSVGSALPNPIDGENIGGLNTGATVYQDLAATVEPSHRYTLSMLVGRRIGNPLGTFTVSLLAGGEVLAEGVPDSPAEGMFAPFQIAYHSPSNGPLLGQNIRIQLKSGGVNAQPWFDDLTLTAVVTNLPPPPPPPPDTDVVITNNSFESPLQADGYYVVNNMPGWVTSGTVALSNPRDDWFVGTSSGSVLANPINGVNVGGINTGGAIHQDLPVVLLPGASYSLTMLVGRRLGVPFGNLTVSLLADGHVLAQGAPAAPGDGAFAPYELTYQSPGSGDSIGKPLRIRLTCGGPNAQAWFDNLRLTINGSPSPVITRQPVSAIVEPGAVVSFSVEAVGGSALGYQWYKGGVALESATEPTLNFSGAQASDAGGYWAVVTNANGSATSQVATLTITNISRVVAHPGFENQEGGGGSGAFRVPIRLQQVYSSTFFPQRPVSITEIRFRPSALYGGAFTNTVANFQLNISTYSNPPAQLSLTFANNVGADDAVVFTGPLALSSAFTTVSGGATKEFDIVIPLTTPFLYDATKGGLLLDVRNFIGGNVANVDAGATSDGKIKRVFAAGNVAATTGASDNGADVIEIRFSAEAAAPYILVQPQGQSVLETERITLGVSAGGDRPLSYQWYRGADALVGAATANLTITNAQSANAGDYSVVVSNPIGSVTSVVANVSVLVSRTLSLTAPSDRQEGTRISVPVELTSRGDVGGMTFLVSYDTRYLKEASLTWAPELEGLFNSVNYAPTGQVRATFALSSPVVPEGSFQVATLSFLLRSVPADLETPLQIQILDASSPAGDPLTVGNLVRGATVGIKKRVYAGDNNANQRLDVGDATVILRHLAGSEQTRPWDATSNDLNSNNNIDSGDAIKVLRAAAGIDPQPGGEGEGLLIAAAADGSPSEALVLTPATARVPAGSLVTFQVRLKDIRTAVAGAAFTLDYPTNALRLVNAQSTRSGEIVPVNALAVWNIAPAQNNYSAQNGHVTFAVSSANAWSAPTGVLAELTFQVQAGASGSYLWPLALRNAEITPDGFDNRSILNGNAAFIGRDPVSGAIKSSGVNATGHFIFTAEGDAGAEYLIESSSNLTNWSLFRRFLNGTGAVQVEGPETGEPQQFFRMRPAGN